MPIKLSDKFTIRRLLKFVTPCIAMMVFTSIYGVIDGLFVSNYAGKTQFAGINIIWPFVMIVGSVGFMIGAGGTAIVSKTIGEGRHDDANKYFSFLIYMTIALGAALAVGGYFAVSPIATLLGAEGELHYYSALYGKILVIGIPLFMLQNVFQAFCTTAERPRFGFFVTLGAGLTNIVFDGVFVAALGMGIRGAAIASVMSQAVGALIPLAYFFARNGSLLRLTRCAFYGKVMLKTFTNGSSEFVGNVSGSVVSMLFNLQLMKLAGENGVAAYGVLMYVNFIYVAIFIGYSIGTAPIIGYNYGAGNAAELKNVFRKSLILMVIFGAVMTGLAEALSYPLSLLFVGYDAELLKMTERAFYIYSVVFLFAGVNIFGSSFFTALNNGLVSALISFLRTLVFQIASVMLLPMLWGLNGVWLSGITSEALATAVTVAFFVCLRKKYKYA